jgi:hypothetical protein
MRPLSIGMFVKLVVLTILAIVALSPAAPIAAGNCGSSGDACDQCCSHAKCCCAATGGLPGGSSCTYSEGYCLLPGCFGGSQGCGEGECE